jgi:hypothetical protein
MLFYLILRYSWVLRRLGFLEEKGYASNVSAEETAEEKSTRFPRTHEDQKRTKGDPGASQQGQKRTFSLIRPAILSAVCRAGYVPRPAAYSRHLSGPRFDGLGAFS